MFHLQTKLMAAIDNHKPKRPKISIRLAPLARLSYSNYSSGSVLLLSILVAPLIIASSQNWLLIALTAAASTATAAAHASWSSLWSVASKSHRLWPDWIWRQASIFLNFVSNFCHRCASLIAYCPERQRLTRWLLLLTVLLVVPITATAVAPSLSPGLSVFSDKPNLDEGDGMELYSFSLR